MEHYLQSPLEHHCHVVRTITEMLIVPIHYLVILDLHLIASWIGAATLLAYTLATYGLHTVRATALVVAPLLNPSDTDRH
ncbi:hypothetical protein [Geomonas ferrireducens]|uniref:hypothetical protein n=1 Tax=Geomonas ferrireducens TaxID=2570227 RepID=UPI0010A8D773|nr:hypothetical protein [Geomonas ferrireducens]